MKIIPLADRVVLKVEEPKDTTSSGIIVVSGDSHDNHRIAEVIAVGPGGFVNGAEVEMAVVVGQKVIISKHSGTQIKLEGQDYTIMRQGEILATINEGEDSNE